MSVWAKGAWLTEEQLFELDRLQGIERAAVELRDAVFQFEISILNDCPPMHVTDETQADRKRMNDAIAALDAARRGET